MAESQWRRPHCRLRSQSAGNGQTPCRNCWEDMSPIKASISSEIISSKQLSRLLSSPIFPFSNPPPPPSLPPLLFGVSTSLCVHRCARAMTCVCGGGSEDNLRYYPVPPTLRQDSHPVHACTHLADPGVFGESPDLTPIS